jgi:hypothetical protein
MQTVLHTYNKLKMISFVVFYAEKHYNQCTVHAYIIFIIVCAELGHSTKYPQNRCTCVYFAFIDDRYVHILHYVKWTEILESVRLSRMSNTFKNASQVKYTYHIILRRSSIRVSMFLCFLVGNMAKKKTSGPE